MNGNSGDTIDFRNFRPTLGQSIAILTTGALVIGLLAVMIDTQRTSGKTMELALKTLAMHSVELAVLDNRMSNIEESRQGESVPLPKRRSALRHQSPNMDD